MDIYIRKTSRKPFKRKEERRNKNIQPKISIAKSTRFLPVLIIAVPSDPRKVLPS